MNKLGIQSLNAGAPDLRLSGDHTQRGTYTQRRRTQMAGGGITNIRQIGKPGGLVEPGIYKYGVWDWVKETAVPFVTEKIVPKVVDWGLDKLGLGGSDPQPQPMPQGSPGQINKPVATIGGPFEQNQYPDPIMTGGKGTQYEEPGGLDWKKALATILPGGDPGYIPGGLYNAAGQLIFGGPTQAGESGVDEQALQRQIDLMTGGGISPHDPDFKIDPAGPYGWEGEDKDDPWYVKLGQTLIPGGETGYFDLWGGGEPQYDKAGNLIQKPSWKMPMALGAAAGLAQQKYLDKQPPFPKDETGIRFQTAAEAMADPTLRFKPQAQYANVAEGGRIGYALGKSVYTDPKTVEKQRDVIRSFAEYKYGGGKKQFASWYNNIWLPNSGAGMAEIPSTGQYIAEAPSDNFSDIGLGTYEWPEEMPEITIPGKMAQGGRIGYANGTPSVPEQFLEDLKRQEFHKFLDKYRRFQEDYKRRRDLAPTQEAAQGGRIGAQEGGLMDLGGMEKDYRQEGGFVPIGGEEKADDVPARLSKNEFVFTADAVRSAGGGDIDEGAAVMERLMENLEAGGKVSEESQGLEGAQEMFANTQRLQNRII